MSKGFKKLETVKKLEKTQDSISLIISIPEENPYFDGHFPGFPVLPAVAQMELILRFASLYLNTGINVSNIKRMKFINTIKPAHPILLKITKKTDAINFNITSPDEKETYSTGIICLRTAYER